MYEGDRVCRLCRNNRIRERYTPSNVVSSVVKYHLVRENFRKRTFNRPVLHERDEVSFCAKDTRCAIKKSLLTER